MNFKVLKKAVSVLLIFATVGANSVFVSAAMKEQNLDYTDSLAEVVNPERGFYQPYCMHLKRTGGSSAKPSGNLVHLRVDISEFSSSAYLDDAKTTTGESTLISDEALQNLSDTLKYIKSQGHTAIVRVAYDRNYDAHSNYEPEQEWILKHLEQLAEVYTENADAIAGLDLGMYGPWGEMHTSKCCTYENVTEALNLLLSLTPKTMKIGVRTPAYVANWMGISYSDFDVNSDAFKEAAAEKGDDIYRVGMYNDGYLGSSSDLGTFTSNINRAKGVAWLNEMAKYTLYGGECVTDDNTNYINAYNTIDYISKEAFETHTTYLNSSWNYNVIRKWMEQTYTGEDEYKGQTAYSYIRDHLGYRFVMRDSKLPVAVKSGGNLDIDLDIENVGFANIINSKKVTVVLKNDKDEILEIEPNEEINPCDFLSKQTTQVKATVTLPKIESGKWDVYFRISKYGDLTSDNNFCCIKFANTAEYWNDSIGANYIGSVIALPESKNEKNVDAAALLKYVSGISDESKFKEEYGMNDADINGDDSVDLRDVIALVE